MSRRLRLLYLDTETVWRGGQEQLSTLMTGMQSRGHRVVLAAPPNAPLAEFATEAGIDVLPYTQRSELSPRSYGILRRVLAHEPFDVIHSNTPRCILAAGLAARAASRRPLRVASRRVIFPLRGRFSALKYNRLLDAVIAVCESIRTVLLEAGLRPELVRTVHEGVDLARIDAIAPAADLPAGREPVVGALGALTAEKGHQTLLAAWSRIVQRFPNALLVLIGEGPCRPSLEAYCRSHGLESSVCFTGFRSDSIALLKSLDLFCIPSLSEGLSSALLEAMGCGLPVVATAIGGNVELVVDGETGSLAPSGDDRELAAALDRLLLDVPMRQSMGRKGRERIERQFTVERKVAQTEGIYLELLDALSIR